MKILLALTAAIFAASLPASAYGLYGDEWLGIEGLRIADVHHTEGYIRGIMNLSGERWTPTLGTGTSDVAGVWSFTLTGEVSRRLDLTLYQAEGEVFGEGTWPPTALPGRSPSLERGPTTSWTSAASSWEARPSSGSGSAPRRARLGDLRHL